MAIAYVLHKTPYVFPIVGGRKPEQLHANLEALKITLEKEHMEYLESVLPFDIGFPLSMIVSISQLQTLVLCSDVYMLQGDGTSYRNVWTASGHLDRVAGEQPIRPSK